MPVASSQFRLADLLLRVRWSPKALTDPSVVPSSWFHLTLPNAHLKEQSVKWHVLIFIFFLSFTSVCLLKYFTIFKDSDNQSAFLAILGYILSGCSLDTQGELKGGTVPLKYCKCKKGMLIKSSVFWPWAGNFYVYMLLSNLVKLFGRTYTL